MIYQEQRAKLYRERLKRKLTGAAWKILKCVKTLHPFYYNTDTREAVWERPVILTKNEELNDAIRYGYSGLPNSIILLIVGYLLPFPDRFVIQSISLKVKLWLSMFLFLLDSQFPLFAIAGIMLLDTLILIYV